MNLKNFTIKSQEAIQRAQQIAMENEHQAIEPAHLMKGVLEIDENVTPFIFKKLGVNFKLIKQTVDGMVLSFPKVGGGEQYLSKSANEVLQKANTFLNEFGDEYVALELLVLGLLKTKDQVSQMLKDNGIIEKDLLASIHELRKGKKVISNSSEDTYNSLEKYATNLTNGLVLASSIQ